MSSNTFFCRVDFLKTDFSFLEFPLFFLRASSFFFLLRILVFVSRFFSNRMFLFWRLRFFFFCARLLFFFLLRIFSLASRFFSNRMFVFWRLRFFFFFLHASSFFFPLSHFGFCLSSFFCFFTFCFFSRFFESDVFFFGDCGFFLARVFFFFPLSHFGFCLSFSFYAFLLFSVCFCSPFFGTSHPWKPWGRLTCIVLRSPRERRLRRYASTERPRSPDVLLRVHQI